MRALILCTLTAAGCHQGTTRSPAPPDAPTALVILEARHGLLVVDPATAAVRPVAGYQRLDWFAIERRGPYVTFGRSDVPYVIDLRDVENGPVMFEELRQTISGAAAMSAGRRDTVVAAITEQGDLRVTVIEPRGGVHPPRTLAAPAANLESVLVSPGGATLAVVAGPRAEGDPPLDLFTIRVSDGATRRWTTHGDVIDAAFVDDDHVVMVVGADDAFELVTLATGEVHRIVVPAGWTAGRLDVYVGWTPGTLFDHDTTGTAPLLPVGERNTGVPRGLFGPRGGGVIALGRDELIVATAPDGSSVLVTTRCDGPGALTRRWLDGKVQELRARPAPAACAANDDGADHVPVSAAFTADGRFLVYAVPSAVGWTARAVDPAGQVRTVRESADPLIVLGRP